MLGADSHLNKVPNWGILGFFFGELDFQKNVGGFYNPPNPNWGLGEGGFGQKIKKITPNPPIGDPNWGLGKKIKKLKNKNKIKIILLYI